jgi:thiol-disulfide isomerase/thioredoxin
MAAIRPYMTFSMLALAGALAASAACAGSTRPVAAPAPPPLAAPPAVAAAPPPSALPAPVAPPAGAASAASAVAPRPPAPAPLVGHVTREQVRSYASWQPLFAQPYLPDPGAIATIKANANDVTVLLIMATWCPDSKRELPRFFAIMDGASMDGAKLTMVGVDRTKKDPEGLTEKWGITRVPTFVFLRNGQEAGRVVEKTPVGATLEGEIARLLTPRVDK